jgi:hypothetical protein
MPRQEIWFHEDDYCQQELLPLAAMGFCLRQVEQSQEFAAEHADPQGAGWTDVYVLKQPPIRLIDLSIDIDTATRIFSAYLPQTSAVTTGYASYREPCERAAAFADDLNALFVKWNKDRKIEAIWTQIFAIEHLDAPITAMQELGKSYPLLYADWAWGFATAVDGSHALRERIVAKLKTIQKRLQK